MSRYIDAYKLIAAVRSFFISMINEAEPLMADDEEAFDLKIVNPLLEANKAIRRIIREQPTVDAVEVIPCEDCKWWDDKYEAERCTHDFGCRWAKPNNFCGYAERRTR